MRREHLILCLLLQAVTALRAGTLQGVVVEHSTGRALSRTAVFLTPVPATASSDSQAAKPVATRTGTGGQFNLLSIPPGMYLLTATRDGFFPGAYGQRLPAGRGAPIVVTAASQFFAEIRLRHRGAVTGRVLDENGVGMPRVPVVACRARMPLRSAGQGTADDRGVYRIPGLEPGKYWVRSASHALEDGSTWLPSFAPQGHEIRDARIFPVTVDADTAYADVSPIGGQLLPVSGKVTCDHAGEVVVTLSSDTGQQIARTTCSPSGPGGFLFPGVPVGLYELFGTFQDNSGAAFIELTVGGRTGADLPLADPPQISMETRMSGSFELAKVPIKLLARRQNLAESGPVFEITGKEGVIPPGYWELRATAPPGYYVHSISPTRSVVLGRRRGGTSSSDWFEFFIPPRVVGNIRVLLARDAARVEGKVVMPDGKPVPGAPVFLWPVAESARRSLKGVPQTLSAADGSWSFENLPPGEYRPLATFDVSEIEDEEMLETSRAPVTNARALQTTSLDIPLWTAPY